MREHEMRMRVFRFLKARLRNTLMPATIGIGLAVGGCAKEGLATSADASGTKDVAEEIGATPVYSAVVPADASAVLRDSATPDGPSSSDAPADAAGKDVAPADHVLASDTKEAGAIDVGGDVGGIDSGRDLGSVVKYGVPIPDASADRIQVVPLYAIVVPPDVKDDAGIIGVRYGAQAPNAS